MLTGNWEIIVVFWVFFIGEERWSAWNEPQTFGRIYIKDNSIQLRLKSIAPATWGIQTSILSVDRLVVSLAIYHTCISLFLWLKATTQNHNLLIMSFGLLSRLVSCRDLSLLQSYHILFPIYTQSKICIMWPYYLQHIFPL